MNSHRNAIKLRGQGDYTQFVVLTYMKELLDLLYDPNLYARTLLDLSNRAYRSITEGSGVSFDLQYKVPIFRFIMK